jgi:hypothetical protein
MTVVNGLTGYVRLGSEAEQVPGSEPQRGPVSQYSGHLPGGQDEEQGGGPQEQAQHLHQRL